MRSDLRRKPMRTDTAQLLINDLGRHNGPLLAELGAQVRGVLESGWYILGKQVETFEKAFAAYCGTAHCVGVANGTDALEVALRAIGAGPGDQIITAANAGGYSVTAIRCAGAEPLFVDITPGSMLMDISSVRSRLTPRTKAIIATHLYGRMVDMPELLSVSETAGVPVIEDCAQAHGARIQGRTAGSWGRLGCFSFYPTKNLGALGDAGAIVTNDSALDVEVRRLRQYGWTKKYQSGHTLGRNSRLDEVQAAVLGVKLRYLDQWNVRRREIAGLYSEFLRDSVASVPAPKGEDDVAHLYVIRTPHRDALRGALAERGIATDVHYPIPDHQQLSCRRAPWAACSLPVTENCCREILTLPCFPEMSDGEVQTVAGAASAFLRKAAKQ